MDIVQIKGLETAIVLGGVLLLFTILVTSLNEMISVFLNLRGRTLFSFFDHLLGSSFFNLIRKNAWMQEKKSGIWSYIHEITGMGVQKPGTLKGQDFSRAIFDTLAEDTLWEIRKWALNNKNILPKKMMDMQFLVHWPLSQDFFTQSFEWEINPQEKDLDLLHDKAIHFTSLNNLLAFTDALRKYAPGKYNEWIDILKRTIPENNLSPEFYNLYHAQRYTGATRAIETGSNLERTTIITLDSIPDPARTYLRTLWMESEGSTKTFMQKLETWFDEKSAQVSQWYQRRMFRMSVTLGILLAFVLNLNPIEITREVWKNDVLRKNGVAFFSDDSLQNDLGNVIEKLDTLRKKRIELQALKISIEENEGSISADSLTLLRQIFERGSMEHQQQMETALNFAGSRLIETGEIFEFPMGWFKKDGSCKPFHWWKIPGFLMMGIFAGWGAPFWYEILNRMVSIRKSLNRK